MRTSRAITLGAILAAAAMAGGCAKHYSYDTLDDMSRQDEIQAGRMENWAGRSDAQKSMDSMSNSQIIQSNPSMPTVQPYQ